MVTVEISLGHSFEYRDHKRLIELDDTIFKVLILSTSLTAKVRDAVKFRFPPSKGFTFQWLSRFEIESNVCSNVVDHSSHRLVAYF